MKNRFFNFFKSDQSQPLSDEDEKQRSYALSKAKEEEVTEIEEFVAPQDSLISEELIQFCIATLQEMLAKSGFGGRVKVDFLEGEKLQLEIIDTDDVGRIIGKEGGTLEAFQTLLRSMMFKKFDASVRLTLDAGGYRKKKEDTLKNIAQEAAKIALAENRKVELRPMKAEERRIIHLMFEEHPQLRANSYGNGAHRHIVLEKK